MAGVTDFVAGLSFLVARVVAGKTLFKKTKVACWILLAPVKDFVKGKFLGGFFTAGLAAPRSEKVLSSRSTGT